MAQHDGYFPPVILMKFILGVIKYRIISSIVSKICFFADGIVCATSKNIFIHGHN